MHFLRGPRYSSRRAKKYLLAASYPKMSITFSNHEKSHESLADLPKDRFKNDDDFHDFLLMQIKSVLKTLSSFYSLTDSSIKKHCYGQD